jgi:hypothetical protein
MIAILVAAAQEIGFTLTSLITLVLGVAGGFSAAFGLVGKKREQVAQIYKDIAEARKAEVEQALQTAQEYRHLAEQHEARIAFLESEFADKLAQGVTRAILEYVRREKLL